MSERMSDASRGGVLDSRSSGLANRPLIVTRVSTPEITRVTLTYTSGFRSPWKLIELASSTSKRRPWKPYVPLIESSDPVTDNGCPGILVERQVAADAQVDVAQADRRARRHLHVLAGELEVVRHVQRDVEAEPVPGVERRDGVDGVDRGHRHLLGGVRLEQQPIENLVHLEVAAVDGDLAADARRLEPPAQLQRGVHVDPAELVVDHLEAAGRRIDLEIADAELVRAQAAVDVERVPVAVLDVQRVDADAIARQAQRRAAVRVPRAGGGHDKRGVGEIDGALKMRIAARADRLHVERDVAAHVAHDVGQPFEQAEADRARRDREVDGALRQIALQETRAAPCPPR